VSDLETFLASIEADPADDLLWLVFADWLEEQGSPISGLVRRAIERENWYEGFGLISRTLPFRQLQLLACDAVEPLLSELEQEPFPRIQILTRHGKSRQTAPIRLIEAVRNDPTNGRRLARLQTEVSYAIPHGLWDGFRNPWLAWSVARCLEKFAEMPRKSCISAARAMAFQKVDVATLPTRIRHDDLNFVNFTTIEGHRDAIQDELRRLASRAIGRHFLAKAAEEANL
jgi:uncharacterized protein (TIGR02996 family)